MLEPVREVLLEEYEWQKEHGFSKYKLDRYSGFVFTNRFDNLYNQGCLNKQIERIRQAYNREEEIKAREMMSVIIATFYQPSVTIYLLLQIM